MMTKLAQHVRGRLSSLSVRLLALTLVWMLIALVATGLFLSKLFEQRIHQQFERHLQVYGDYLVAAIELDAQGKPILMTQPPDPRFSQPLSGLYWQLDDEQGNAVLRSRSLWDTRLVAAIDPIAPGQPHFHVLTGPADTRILVLEQSIRFDASPDRSWRLLIGESAAAMDESLMQWRESLTLFLGVLFVTLAIAAVFQVVLGLSPLRRLKSKIQDLRLGRRNRIDGNFPSEIDPLVRDFNSVLDANDKAVEQARYQAEDLAHALKTPLSVLATAVDDLLKQDKVSSQVHEALIEQVSIMRSQLQWRLQNARHGASPPVFAKPMALQPVIDGLMRAMHKIYADRQLQITQAPHALPLCFLGQEQDLEEALGNILDNACKWAASEVLVELRYTDGWIQLVVSDDGPGIEADRRSAVAQRGVRMDERVPGSGLGLAIVSGICGKYGGSMSLGQSQSGGLSVQLSLPGRRADF